MIDEDVAQLLLMLLRDAPMEVRAGELAVWAEVHARAVAQVKASVHQDRETPAP
jgi:hypothetical protein